MTEKPTLDEAWEAISMLADAQSGDPYCGNDYLGVIVEHEKKLSTRIEELEEAVLGLSKVVSKLLEDPQSWKSGDASKILASLIG